MSDDATSRPITIAEWTPEWAECFAALADELRAASLQVGIHADAFIIEHIGSTSVEGLAAKPKIDMLATAPTLDELTLLAQALHGRDGWRYRSEFESGRTGMPARRMCALDAGSGRVANLHMWAAGDPEVARHIDFRNQLREHPEERRAYELLKRELANHHIEIGAYTDAKSDLVHAITARATLRELDGAVAVDSERFARLATLDGLAEWWCSSVRKIDHERAELVVEEEYGYRRRLAVRVTQSASTDTAICLAVERAEREWDGQPGAQPGMSGSASRWPEVDLEDVTIEVCCESTVLSARIAGLPAAALDVARREGAALVHALERAGAGIVAQAVAERCVHIDCELQLPPSELWSIIDRQDSSDSWIGPTGLIAADPGTPWSVGTHRGSIHGRILLAVAGRRLVMSWHDPDPSRPPAMFDLRLRRVGAGTGIARTALAATLTWAAPTDNLDPDGVFTAALDDLVRATTPALGT